ncbi:MAG: bacteriohemerythrin [Proteobacteria bacterium]|nr:bacteriohemerythrin [Pseudomonadota bacterium]
MPAIRKVEVTPGVYWVEIRDAEMFILCGCPADSVKHLMKRGLIIPEEKNGVQTETGPNAILLSDTLIQNGSFSNLAEFPVLQMLYRQGLILPGHPNNTGQKPLLMGSEPQVQSQLRYIHRGNYGLLSERELIQAGLSPARARAEMRLKLRFAFGQIKRPEEILDTMAIGEACVQIRGGVGLCRLAHNRYEFSYEGETVQVDLNLPKGMQYASPYPLCYQDAGRGYFDVIHSGDGDGWDVNRPTMSSVIMYQGEVYLIDAGPNIQHTLSALGIGVNEVRGLFHTHAHDDHFCGLTALMQADHRILHYATPHVRASVSKKWAALLARPESEFAAYFELRDLTEGRWNSVQGLEVKPVFSPHPVETNIMFFRTRTDGRYQTYAHLADIASRSVLDRFLTDDDNAPGLSQRLYNKVWKDYLTRVDVKKLDIGGGLIHGQAADFNQDNSAKIILSHTARTLDDHEREIGSGATFGMMDRLIEGTQDFLRSLAYRHLRRILPVARDPQLRMLMNGEMVTLNPETILLRRGQPNKDVYLMVTGVVERIDSKQGLVNECCAGALLGELSGLAGQPCAATYRALTHVRALRLPATLLKRVIEDNNLGAYFETLRVWRDFLRQTWLLGGSTSSAVQDKVAGSMMTLTFKPGQTIGHDKIPAIYLIHEGQAEVHYKKRMVEAIGPGDFIGEGFVLFDTPCITTGVALTELTALHIHAGLLREVPIVRWKLFETFRRRMEAVVESTKTGQSIFTWREEYSTGVPRQDRDHQQLLAKADEVHRRITTQQDKRDVAEALEELIRYTAAHFGRELGWYEEEAFPELEHHRLLHRQLLEEIRTKAIRIKAGIPNPDVEFVTFFKNWLIDHIMTEDRKFGRMMEFKQG